MLARHEPSLSRPRPLSAVQAGVAMVKCSIGAGCFALPYAYANAGILLSIVVTCLLSAASAYTINLLLVVEVRISC